MEKKLMHCWILACALHLITPSCLAQNAMSLATDQSALLSLKSHITSDPSRTLATNWTESNPVCSWYGVTCGSCHPRVAALNLSNLNLTGTIPPQLGQLSFLVSLDLKSNNFSGALSEELSQLRRLKFISLRLNNFTGDIPPLFARFPRLEYLNLRENGFTGGIPGSLSNLTKLQFLSLTSNSLSGEIPQELGRLRALRELWIEFNRLSGGIPAAIFNVSTLAAVGFSGNELSGSLPADLCRDLPFLAELLLSENRLSDSIPTNLSRCSRLVDLSLSYNSFSGTIPAEIASLTSLRILGLGGDNLSGILPRGIGNLEGLVVFAVEGNQIEGSIDFNVFKNMSSLQTLLLWRNRFTGNLSREFGNLTMLTSLELAENRLTEIGQLYRLESLTLGLNSFNGWIPHELFNISTIRRLALDINALTGILPSSLCHGSPVLEELYLGTTFITGPIPNSISNCSQLRILVVSENKFSGHIPPDLGNLRLLEILQLSNNNLTDAHSFSSSEPDFITSLANCRFLTRLVIGANPLYGTIPTSVGNLSLSLQIFDANSCKFNGSIPVEMGKLSSLGSLDLHDNELSGNIPLTFKNLQLLQGLFLSDNRLEGSIPETICSLHSLIDLDMSRNKISGSIPKCLGNVSSLRKLFLGSNLLNSSIPPTLWDLKDLMNLDLSSNSLNGALPEEISNLGVAIYVNLSTNQLSGSIPNAIGKLQNLVNLSLAHNRLEGVIPVSSMGSMIGLVTLDLSYNNLSDFIPKSLEALQHLHYFNVSFNYLSGAIPSAGPFENFTVDSFKGNDALCGIPKFHVPICPGVSDHGSKRRHIKLAIFIVLGVVGFIMVVSLVFIGIRYKRKDKTTSRVDEWLSIEPERISYYELVQGTEQFSESNLIGTGSSCSVYKGILNSGKVIDVKVFDMQLEGTLRRFDAECEILRNIRHKNLTSGISSCSNVEFKALVLEYVPNGNLEQWLYSDERCLSVVEILNIMIDVASALEYLHHGHSTPIVHSDIKPSNVLLDEDMVAHVSDFGIAKLLSNGDSFVLTKTFATLGYNNIAPEYGSEGLVSTRCDVYSYGGMFSKLTK